MCKLDEYATVQENPDGSVTLSLRPGVTYTTMAIKENTPGEDGYKHLSIKLKLRHEADRDPILQRMIDDPELWIVGDAQREKRPVANTPVRPGRGREQRPQ